MCEAVAARNQVGRIDGFSPAQWSFGRAPKWHGELWEASRDEDAENVAKTANGDFQKKLQLQAQPRAIHEQSLLRQQMAK
eukprot:1403857-Alexandrium_andersonii.AAC.1